MSYADDLQAVSVDEALVDVSTTVENARRRAAIDNESTEYPDFARQLAESIRTKVRNKTGCEGENVVVSTRRWITICQK